jgi:DNA polymerase-1
MRFRAKAVNFGILYGMSETRLARDQGIPRAEARRFIEAYFERFREVKAYIEQVRAQAVQTAEVRTLFGRVRRFPQLRGRSSRPEVEQALRAAVNTTIQGTAADLMKLAMIGVDRILRQHGLGARMLLQVHDELLLEVPESEVDRAGPLIREAMEGVHPLEVPLAVDQKTGRSWQEVT